MIGILIALHEFGHFAAAKACGVKVNEFSIGMGPQILHGKKGETVYSLRLLPIGGFCAMEGESEEESKDPRAFPNRPWWQRLIILLAGVGMNFLTGLLLIALLLSGTKEFYTPVVSGFLEGSTAREQGLREGDRVVKVNGHRIYQSSDIAYFLGRDDDAVVELELRRGGESVRLENFQAMLVRSQDGYVFPYLGINATPERVTPLSLVRRAWHQSIQYVRIVWYSLGDLITGHVGLRDMSGIVGMMDMMGQLGEEGAQAAVEQEKPALLGAVTAILDFVAFIAINLAVMNLLPIPALDGGQIFLMAVNGVLLKLRGRKMDPKYQGWVSAAGFACLLALMLAVTVSDILKQFGV